MTLSKESQSLQSRLVPVDLLYFESPLTEGQYYFPLVLHEPMKAVFRSPIYDMDPINPDFNLYAAPKQFFDKLKYLLKLSLWRKQLGSITFNSMLDPLIVDKINRDRLILNSGISSACILKAKGELWINVLMTEEVCQLWDNRSTGELKELIAKQNRTWFYNPIFHSDFRFSNIARPTSIRIDRFRRLLGELGENLHGIDIGCNMGYMCHFLHRHGFTMVGVDRDEEHLSLAKELNSTYNLYPTFYNAEFENLEFDHHFDIAVLLAVFYHALNRGNDVALKMIRRIESITNSALFWESGDRPHNEINFIMTNSNFKIFLSLGKTHGTSKNRVLGVFLKPGAALNEILLIRHKTEFPQYHKDSHF
jgi:hypothetical protein